MNCLFCQIVAGEVPADIVHQDERCIAFRDIKPQAPVHILVIPREHMESLEEATQKDEALLGHLLRVGARVANQQAPPESGHRTIINTGANAGQLIFHLHVHVLGGRSLSWPPG